MSDRNVAKGKNIFLTLITIPLGCRDEGSFAESCTSKMIFMITFITFDFSVIFRENITFIANICSTLITGPFKRFVFRKDFKLGIRKISTF